MGNLPARIISGLVMVSRASSVIQKKRVPRHKIPPGIKEGGMCWFVPGLCLCAAPKKKLVDVSLRGRVAPRRLSRITGVKKGYPSSGVSASFDAYSYPLIALLFFLDLAFFFLLSSPSSNLSNNDS